MGVKGSTGIKGVMNYRAVTIPKRVDEERMTERVVTAA